MATRRAELSTWTRESINRLNRAHDTTSHRCRYTEIAKFQFESSPPSLLSSASVSYILSTTIWNGDNLAWNYFAIRRNNAIFEKEFHAKMLFYSASNIFLKEEGRFKMNLYADFKKCSPVFNGGGGWNFRAWMYPHGFFRGNLLSIWFIDTPRNSWLNICRCIKYNGVGRECLIEDTREITRSRGSPINYSSLPPSLPFPVM